MDNITAQQINQCIASVCINKESLEKFKSVLDQQPGLYSRCEAFVTAYRGIESSRNLSNVAQKKLDFLGRQAGLTPDSLQLLNKALRGESVKFATASFVTPAMDGKRVTVLNNDRTVLKEQSKDPVPAEIVIEEVFVKRKAVSRNPTPKGKNAKWMIGIAAAVGALVLAFTFPIDTQSKPPTLEDRLDEAIQRLNLVAELGTIEYNLSGVHTETDPNWLSTLSGWFREESQKAIALKFKAKVKAGIDLDGFSRERNVEISGQSVRVTLPKARVLSYEILDIKDEPYAGMLRSDYTVTDIHLVQQHAEEALLDKIASGVFPILRDAETNARDFFGILLNGLGFTSVQVVFE